MKSKVHPRYKTKYRVANWAAYNQALVRRGDVTVWVSSEAIAAWTPRRSGRRGGQRRYSDLAIETALTLRLLYHLPLRPAEGFLHALFGMMRLDLSAPDYTTLSRRSQHLRRRLRPIPPGEGLHLVLDSTGLSIVGADEWAAATHGGRGRRGWKKLHLGVDQSGVIRVHTLTEATGEDATTAYGATKRPRLVARIAEAWSVAGRGCSPSPQDMPDAQHVLVLPVAGWVNRPPDNQIAYLREEQRGLRAWRLGWARRVPVVGRGGTQRWHPTQCAH